MIVCVTPNAALDRTLIVPGFATDGVFRPKGIIVDAGGKGINVARAIRVLGGESLCCGFLGGHTGQQIAESVQADDIEARWTPVANGESRTCTIIVNPEQSTSAVVNEAGIRVDAADWRSMQRTLLDCAGTASTLCFCGTLPQASPLESYRDVLAALVDTGCSVWVDSSGEALAAASTVPGVRLKINAGEAGALLKHRIDNWQEAGEAADSLSQQVSAPVVLTRGSEGAIFVSAAGCWKAVPPPIQLASTVGSGDALLGGLLVALERGEAAPAALSSAVAAGTANAQALGGARFSRADFDQLLAQTKVKTLS